MPLIIVILERLFNYALLTNPIPIYLIIGHSHGRPLQKYWSKKPACQISFLDENLKNFDHDSERSR
jgi:hypothetical protein